MTVHVRLFAGMAQHAPSNSQTLDVPEGSCVRAVKTELLRLYPQLPWPKGTAWAVNQEYAREDRELRPGDEVGIIPPVSGG
jgi:molybdopterin converting factor small subunit